MTVYENSGQPQGPQIDGWAAQIVPYLEEIDDVDLGVSL